MLRELGIDGDAAQVWGMVILLAILVLAVLWYTVLQYQSHSRDSRAQKQWSEENKYQAKRSLEIYEESAKASERWWQLTEQSVKHQETIITLLQEIRDQLGSKERPEQDTHAD